MLPTKAHIEVGPFKFDFEGDDEAVTKKIEMVQPLIQAWLAKGTSIPPRESTTQQVPTKAPNGSQQIPEDNGIDDPALARIFKRGKVLSLHTRPEPRKAFLLTLYGYKMIQNQDVIGAAQLVKSLTDTGINYGRVSRLAEPLEAERLINVSGQKKGTRYVLTNAGIAEAEKILQEEKGTL